MKKQKLMKIAAFSEIYNLTPSSIYLLKDGGRYGAYVDENFFIKRRDFYNKVVDETQQYYYFFNRHLDGIDIATMLCNLDKRLKFGSTHRFFYEDLFTFTHGEKSIINYKIPIRMWIIWRSFREAVNILFRSRNIPRSKRDIQRIWDVISK